jgi:site-specific DNA-cytosine methylase
MRAIETEREILHGHIFCGIGGGAIGFNRGQARVGSTRARFTCVGGVDVDPAAVRDFRRHVGANATCLDLFTLEQYQAFHGKMPPPGWTEASPDDVRRAFGNRRPNIVFLSAPCKGFSGLLSETASLSDKYQALNGLTLRGVWLTLEAFKDDPVELVVFENVPRIATRGRALLDRINALLDHYGYAHAETTHDCGELGDLAQSRKRFLLVARHKEKVPPFLHEPDRHKLRGVGEVLDLLPMPLSGLGGPMHRMPSLQWKTWVRLAFVRAGGDWRSLNELAIEGGVLRDYGIVPGTQFHNGAFGVRAWGEHAGTVTGNGRPASGSFSVADPRPAPGAYADRANGGVGHWDQPAATITSQRSPLQGRFAVADPRREPGRAEFGQYGVKEWREPSQAVTAQAAAGAGKFSVADPRIEGKPRFNSTFRIVRWGEASPAVAGPGGPAGGLAVADPRPGYGGGTRQHILKVTKFDQPAGTVTSGAGPTNGGAAVADPRPPNRDGYVSTKYRVTPYDEHSRTVIGASTTGDGAFAVADPRLSDGRATRLGVKSWGEPSGVVAGESHPSNGPFAVADPRPTHGPNAHASKHRVSEWTEPSGAVTGSDRVGSGAPCVADPIDKRAADRYGVLRFDEPARAVTGHGQHDNGYNSVADERASRSPDLIKSGESNATLPAPTDRLVAVIFALDGTWHRPFTTLELAALQGLVDPEEQFELDGLSDASWRERIGNCVPPPSAQAIAGVMGETLLLAWSGQTFQLSNSPIWVRQVAVALSVKPDEVLP